MENKKDFIAFDVDETLHFERGQEIAEMLSISLDPDIALDIYEAYVQIRGIIVLNGAYRKAESELSGESSEHIADIPKYIEKIVDKEDRQADFYHRFPVDISIPKERVNHVEDVSVVINTFDYELPDHQTLKVVATVHITGLVEEVKIIEEPEIKEEPKMEKAEEIEIIEQDEPEEVTDEIKNEAEAVEVDEHDDTPLEAEHHYEQEKKGIDISLSKSEESEEKDEVKDVRFLTDLFGDDEEEMQTTVTLYIIQEEDTVESIAKRFEIPTLKLVKDNNLSEDTLTNGQLLYIERN